MSHSDVPDCAILIVDDNGGILPPYAATCEPANWQEQTCLINGQIEAYWFVKRADVDVDGETIEIVNHIVFNMDGYGILFDSIESVSCLPID